MGKFYPDKRALPARVLSFGLLISFLSFKDIFIFFWKERKARARRFYLFSYFLFVIVLPTDLHRTNGLSILTFEFVAQDLLYHQNIGTKVNNLKYIFQKPDILTGLIWLLNYSIHDSRRDFPQDGLSCRVWCDWYNIVDTFFLKFLDSIFWLYQS